MRKILKDGRMMYLRREIPKSAPAGYVKTTDPYMFAPIQEPCTHLHDDLELSCGGKTRQIYICLRLLKKIQPGDCYLCGLKHPPPA